MTRPHELPTCSCTRCPDCNGSGHTWVDYRGRAIPHGFDVGDTLEPCDRCRGSGIDEECDRCADERERLEDEQADLQQTGGY